MTSSTRRYSLLLAVILSGQALPAIAQLVQYPTKIMTPTYHDTSPALLQLIANAPKDTGATGLERTIPNAESPVEHSPFTGEDPVLQKFFVSSDSVPTAVNFEGMGNLCACSPPDPNGAPGPEHFFQTVNTHFAIWNKQGTQVQAPRLLKTLWTGTPWEDRSDGDPVVLFDRYANRWVIVQFYLSSSDYVLFAVSASSDPLGSYHRYGFEFEKLPDYPKIAVWPDAYYLSVASQDGPTYVGDGVAAVERDRMLVGSSARIVFFQRTTEDPRLLPSDVDGTLPPSGSPNYFTGIEISTQRLRIYELAVSWSNPGNSTFTNVVNLPTAEFAAPVCNSRDCIPQPSSSVGLDALSNRLMFRLQYRNFGIYQTMVANHTVKIGTSGRRAGIRWYELRKTSGNWAIYQQGTYAPDDNSRWMASIAMDKFGNIGLGYSVSSGSVYPSIRFTGRQPTDPLGQMTFGEATVVSGSGVQTSTQHRWGDYSSLHLDPSDDWTMWYTNEYMQATGEAPWQTRIAAFQIPAAAITITLDQQRQDESRLWGTSIGRWDGASFSGIAIPVPPGPLPTFPTTAGAREILRGAQQMVANPEEKFRVWRRGSEDQLDTVQNHRGFTIRNFHENLISRFERTWAIDTIRTALLDAPWTTGGTIQFHDPWYIDYQDPAYGNNWRNRGMQEPRQFHTRSLTGQFAGGWTPDFTTTYAPHPYPYNGVFLNQDYSVPGSPYYSVGAPSTNTLAGLESHFQGWKVLAGSASFQDASASTTGVVFQNAGTTVAALYKAPLHSSSASATSAGGQRRYAADEFESDRRGAICYESGGEIWLSDFLIGGFMPEVRVSAGTGGFSAPSLFVANGGLMPLQEGGQTEAEPIQAITLPQLATVYQRLNGSNKEVWFRENRANNWRDPVLLTAGSATEKLPVIGRRGVEDWEYSRMVAVWQESNGLVYTRATSTTNGWTWTTPALVPGTSSARFNPGIANAPHDSDSLFLTSDNGGDVVLQRLAPYTGGWRTAAIAVPASIAPVSYRSQVHAEYGNPAGPTVHVVWEVQYGDIPPTSVEPGKEHADLNQYKVMYQRREGSAWTAAAEFAYGGSTALRRPSVTKTAAGAVIVTWDDGINTYRSTSTGSTWSVAQVSQAGKYANLVSAGPHGGLSSAGFVNTGNSGAPYPLQVSTEQTMGFGGIGISTRYSRRIVVARTAGEGETSPAVSLELGTVTVRRSGDRIDTIGLAPISDSQPDLDEKALLGLLRTSTVTGLGTAESVFVEALLTVQNAGEIRAGALRVGLDLLNAEDDGVVRSVGNEIAVSSDTTIALRLGGRIANSGVQTARIRPRMVGLRTTLRDLVYSVVHVHTLEPAGAQVKDGGMASPAHVPDAVPAVLALHPSFPNPFNPSTEFRFDLPEPSTVSLAVFDLLGRKVADLAEGEYEAGYHTATWNAAGAASGVYLARFTATSAAGDVAYTRTHKLVLMK